MRGPGWYRHAIWPGLYGPDGTPLPPRQRAPLPVWRCDLYAAWRARVHGKRWPAPIGTGGGGQSEMD